ncbi:uncharacterized protein TRAVEDRAFT_17041 [Trametes versicolor FP-101664 SS1]|uniref:uncharacterized protein n=1 Tax=Trametes versicolor (strain FP-101664) TaxID=717944 RepID=UPI0004623591|nr:uncharacterized protein TRAVEDRAFT_17041 [Trametes versicolor FP-101664 SS1]EIW65273.1 hypothetical protein TRAVEDRAFT_17041 [Trametes versicolor FP-101664 SS1]
MYYVAYIRERIAAMLSVCYALQSLHLDSVGTFDFWPHANSSATHDPLSTPSPLPPQACRHLRGVALVSLDGYLIAYILSLLTEKTKLDVQIHSVLRDLHFPLPRHFLGAISKVGIARYPQPVPFYKFPRPPDSPFMWGITLSGSERTVRRVGDEFEALTRMLYEEDAALAGVRELWLADVSPATCDEPHMLRAAEADQVRALIQGMPVLETVVLINQFQAPWTGAPPSLRLLPDARDSDRHIGPRSSTVRIAHGYGKHVLQRWPERPNPIPSVPPLNLTCILEELASGAYDYVQHLAIEVPYHIAVDAGDVERLREYCDAVQVKVMDVTPTISLPEYCYEPKTWAASDDPWPYKLW